MQHHRLSPSSSGAWIDCPAFATVNASIPDKKSEHANEGKAAHAVLEYCLKHDEPASVMAGAEIHLDDGDAWTVDDEMVEHVQTTIDYVNRFPGLRLVEQRIDLDPWIPGGFGTSDVVVLADGIATLPDFKYGKGVRVYARENTQLLTYALGAYHAVAHLYEIDLFRLCIAQPRLDNFDEWEIRVPDLLAWGDDVLRPAVVAASAEFPRFNPTDRACRWCRFAPRCRTLAEHSLAVAQRAFAEPPPELSNDEIGDILRRWPIAEAWAKRLEETAFAELAAGRDVPGWKIVEGRSKRAWSSIADATAKLRDAGVSDDQMFEPRELISPAKAEKVFGKKHAATDCVVRPEGKPTLAPVTDKRPPFAVKRSAADAFQTAIED